MFGHIVPCGIADLPVTTLEAEGLDLTDGRRGRRPGGPGHRPLGGRRPTDDHSVTPPAPGPRPPAPRTGRPAGPGHHHLGTTARRRPPAAQLVHLTPRAERPLLRRFRRAGVDPGQGLAISSRKPEWLRVKAHMGPEYLALVTDRHRT